MQEPIILGVSLCLLGEKVRYNGGHSRDPFICDTLSRYVRLAPVCPEVECGFPVPRETLRLEGDPEAPRLVTTETRVDHTERMLSWCDWKVKELEPEDLCGFIFKKGSPSCGMERVKVYDRKGLPAKQAVGMFARAFVEHFPLLPVEEDERLYDPEVRENFVEAIFTLKRWKEALIPRSTKKAFVEFHNRHELVLMAHSPRHTKLMGKMVADMKSVRLAEFRAQYESSLLVTLRSKTTPSKHIDALLHAMGYLKDHLSNEETQELGEIIEDYRHGHVPLIVPVTLLKHFARKFDGPYLREQYYLNPHPVELQLRSHA